MTVAELIEELRKKPQDAQVVAAFSPSRSPAYIEDVTEVSVRRDLCGSDPDQNYRLDAVEIL